MDRLKEEVEQLVGRKIKSPKDFDFLSRQIAGLVEETVSVSTLKRMWGYVKSTSKPSQFNLDLLSRMVGYPDWEAFCRKDDGPDSSRFFVKSKLIADIFICHQIVADEPLYLSNLQHADMPLCNYVCGQSGGVKWNLGGKT